MPGSQINTMRWPTVQELGVGSGLAALRILAVHAGGYLMGHYADGRQVLGYLLLVPQALLELSLARPLPVTLRPAALAVWMLVTSIAAVMAIRSWFRRDREARRTI